MLYNQNKVNIYHKIKSDYISDFNLVLSSKSVMCDLIVLGIEKDIFIKIVYYDDKINIEQLLHKIKSRLIWRSFLKTEYIIYYYDENYSLKEKKVIIL